MVNGRLGEDAGVGKCTYVGSRGSSLINYVIAGTELFEYFSNFCVEGLNLRVCIHFVFHVRKWNNLLVAALITPGGGGGGRSDIFIHT